MTQKPAGIFKRKRFDIDDLRRQPGRTDGRLPLFDIICAGSDQQHVEQLRVFLVRSDDFVVKADLFHRERDVLICLDFDLALQVTLGETRRHLDDLGDGRIAADCYRNIGRLSARSFDGPSYRFTDSLGVNNRLFTDRARWRGLCRIGLDAISLAALRQLYQFDGRRRYVESQQQWGFFAKEHVFFLLGR